MKLTLAEPKYLKDSVTIISELVNEATFKITPNAIELVAMDPANVAMVVFKLLSSCFTEYDVKGNVELAINLNNLKQILRRAKLNDMLSLELGQDNKLILQFKSNTTRTFSLPIIELDDKEQKIPDLKFQAVVNVPASLLNEAIEDVDIIAESVTFEADSTSMNIIAEGDLSKAKIELTAGDEVKIEVPGSSKIRAKYSVEYLKKMVDGSKLADHVSIYFSDDYPLKLEYKSVDKVMLSFILAPRVEND